MTRVDVTRRRHPVLGVVGGSGGVGVTHLAAALATAAAPALLLDLDVAGGGIDVVLGLEHEPGARWSGLHVAGGRLAAEVLLGGLPRWGTCPVLAADVAELDPAAVAQVIDTAAAVGPVIADLPRGAHPERAVAVARCDLVVVLARADVAGVVAAHAAVGGVRGDLDDGEPLTPVGLVVRRGDIPARDVAELVGAPLLGQLPTLPARRVGEPRAQLPRALARVAGGVLSGLAAPQPWARTGPLDRAVSA